jgi:hypothetical protein
MDGASIGTPHFFPHSAVSKFSLTLFPRSSMHLSRIPPWSRLAPFCSFTGLLQPSKTRRPRLHPLPLRDLNTLPQQEAVNRLSLSLPQQYIDKSKGRNVRVDRKGSHVRTRLPRRWLTRNSPPEPKEWQISLGGGRGRRIGSNLVTFPHLTFPRYPVSANHKRIVPLSNLPGTFPSTPGL